MSSLAETRKKVLIVDDDEDLRYMVKEVISQAGYDVREASDGFEALRSILSYCPDAVLLDLRMPRMEGIETLCEIKKLDPHIQVIILTGHGDIKSAVAATKGGAYDFVTKPPVFDELLLLLKRALEMRDLVVKVERATTALEVSMELLFGRSEAIKPVIQQIQQVANTDFTIIIQGETGTGKTVVANAIHNMGRRSGHPFVRVDIGLIPDSLVESELFGYRKGAFTGADRNKSGYFESAAGGTIFIDEVENMSQMMQGKLLGVIEMKRIYQLGSTEPEDINVRVIAATNKDINLARVRKEFREDLFYRMAEFVIKVPPLRERAEDIPFFAQKFMMEACSELGRQMRGLSEGAISALLQHKWPGNVRELKNVIRMAVLQSESGMIESEQIEAILKGQEARETDLNRMSLKDALRTVERSKISQALEMEGGNKKRAAEFLKVSYKNFCDKVREYGLEAE